MRQTSTMKSCDAILEKLQNISNNRPLIHRVETERSSDNPNERAYWGVGTDLMQYLVTTVEKDMKTAETGCGLSTLAFSAIGSTHTVITPDAGEEAVVRKEAATWDISMANTQFAIGFSEDVLPQLKLSGLSLALVDGKHAFPWAIIDWFYFARAMKKNGIMIIDDATMPSVKILCDLLDTTSEWKKIESFQGGYSIVYRCLKENALDVIWNEQAMNKNFGKAPLSAKVMGKLKSMVRGR